MIYRNYIPQSYYNNPGDYNRSHHGRIKSISKRVDVPLRLFLAKILNMMEMDYHPKHGYKEYKTHHHMAKEVTTRIRELRKALQGTLVKE
jgi:hypothetical protein